MTEGESDWEGGVPHPRWRVTRGVEEPRSLGMPKLTNEEPAHA